MAGFDPVHAHHEKKKTGKASLSSPTENHADSGDLAQIHILARDFGLIDGANNKGAYYQMIERYFPGVKSSVNMTTQQRAQFITMLRAWIKARDVAIRLDDTGA
jgi:hypothetical protein